MVELAVKNDGPTFNLSFPTQFEDTAVPPGRKPSLHHTQTFTTPKTESRAQRYRTRSQSWSSKYEHVSATLKPIGYSIQPPALEVAPIRLPLQGKFIWPEREFSISAWFKLEDNNANRLVERHESFMAMRSHRTLSLPLYCYNEIWCEHGCEDLFHLFSFGNSSAVFEVWLGARTGHLQYRWIVSNVSLSSDEKFMIFDQVTVPHAAHVNVWHHLVISLILPRTATQPQASELEGSQCINDGEGNYVVGIGYHGKHTGAGILWYWKVANRDAPFV